jgi:hypothetical protein
MRRTCARIRSFPISSAQANDRSQPDHPELVEEQLRTSEQLVALAYLVPKIIDMANDMTEFIFLSPDITEFALRKSIVRALKIFHGMGLNWKI